MSINPFQSSSCSKDGWRQPRVGVVVVSFNSNQAPLRLNIKNEFLRAKIGEQTIASVPDLITVLDFETAAPINAERLRYGQRVTVLGIGCPAYYRTAQALAVVAPRCFGFDQDYIEIERLAAFHQVALTPDDVAHQAG